MVGMRNFQDTFKTRKRSFCQCFFNLHDSTFKVKLWCEMIILKMVQSKMLCNMTIFFK